MPLSQSLFQIHFVACIDANALFTGVLEVNVDTVEEGKEKICPHVKMEQIKSDMLLCAPFVKSLRVSTLFYLPNFPMCICQCFLSNYSIDGWALYIARKCELFYKNSYC